MREHSVVFDRYGIDPLKDKLALSLDLITDFSYVTVSEDLEHRADLISALQYDRSDLDYVILEFNDLGHESELVKGLDIKIPNLRQVLQIISRNKKTTPSINLEANI